MNIAIVFILTCVVGLLLTASLFKKRPVSERLAVLGIALMSLSLGIGGVERYLHVNGIGESEVLGWLSSALMLSGLLFLILQVRRDSKRQAGR